MQKHQTSSNIQFSFWNKNGSGNESKTPRRDRMLESEHGKAQPADLSDVLHLVLLVLVFEYW